jgi:nucleotide-binding universal stress UspA family protein
MAEDSPDRYIVVGVTQGQHDVVLRAAVRFARQFDAVLVCANVDPGSYVVAEHPDGSVTTRPIDPDLRDWSATVFDQELATSIRQLAGELQVPVIFRELAGEVAHALSRLADVLQAEMIVVGSRKPGVRSGIVEFLGGSVAVHLAHRQHRPVVVVPLSPLPTPARLPWEEAES